MSTLYLTPHQLALVEFCMDYIKHQMDVTPLCRMFGISYDLASETQLATDLQSVIEQLSRIDQQA